MGKKAAMENAGTERAGEPATAGDAPGMTSLGGDIYTVVKEESQPCRVRWKRGTEGTACGHILMWAGLKATVSGSCRGEVRGISLGFYPKCHRTSMRASTRCSGHTAAYFHALCLTNLTGA